MVHHGKRSEIIAQKKEMKQASRYAKALVGFED